MKLKVGCLHEILLTYQIIDKHSIDQKSID